MVGHEDHRIPGGGHLHGPGHDALGVEFPAARSIRSAARTCLGPQADPDPVGRRLHHEDLIAELRQCIGVELLGVGAGQDAQPHRRPCVELAGAAGHEMIPERRRPRPGGQRSPGPSGPAPRPVNWSVAELPNHSGPRKPPATDR